MPDQITMTLSDLWQFFMIAAGAIITLSGAGAVIANIVHKAKAPNKKQDERLAALENDVKDINERLELGNRRFESDANKVTKLEQTMKTTNKIIVESLQALTAHAIDGNNIEQLKQAERSLNDYLIEKI